MFPRRKTRKITLGDAQHGFVSIGGDAPVAVQTMTSGYTYDIDKCVAEINKMAAGGADETGPDTVNGDGTGAGASSSGAASSSPGSSWSANRSPCAYTDSPDTPTPSSRSPPDVPASVSNRRATPAICRGSSVGCGSVCDRVWVVKS